MEAMNRLLPDWFTRIRTGQLLLPRFQRHEAWGHSETAALLESVLRGLPAGATLILEIGSTEPFHSRPMSGAPKPTERVTEHLLDGQQRLTALWRSFNDNYDNRTYFVYSERDEETGEKAVQPSVYGQARWERDGSHYPLWADEPKGIHQREYIPLRLLRPGDVASEIGNWCDEACEDDLQASRKLERHIVALKERVTTFNLPYLSLPVETPKDVALDVFVKLNTSSVRLTAFDIVVAQVEEATGKSLHQLVGDLVAKVPQVSQYVQPEDLILSVAAMREDRGPTQKSYQQLDYERLVEEWPQLVNGVKWAVECLEGEKIMDGMRLPTIAVIPVMAALHDFVPAALDGRGNAKILTRKYLWRSFLTGRYENAAATRTLQDLRGLRDLLQGKPERKELPVFDEELYPLPGVEQLVRAGWPKTRDVLARGILALSLKAGGTDLADGQLLTTA